MMDIGNSLERIKYLLEVTNREDVDLLHKLKAIEKIGEEGDRIDTIALKMWLKTVEDNLDEYKLLDVSDGAA